MEKMQNKKRKKTQKQNKYKKEITRYGRQCTKNIRTFHTVIRIFARKRFF